MLCDECFDHFVQPTNSTCYRCNKLSNNFKTCRSCRSSSPIFSVFKLSYYEGPLKKLILRTKFDGARAGAEELGKLLARHSPTFDIDFVTYVPTAGNRVRYRGFDHALVMASTLSRALGKPLVTTLVRKGKVRQFGSGRMQRKKQIQGTFYDVNQERINGAKVLLVDDVISTGATIEESARVIKQAGAKRIYVLVAAHNR